MFDRRHLLKAGAAAIGSLALTPRGLRAQGKLAAKVRYNEVVRSILYTPAYIAMSKGFFAELGLDVTMTTAQGGDKSIAALVGDSADIALIGPETAIYVLNSESPTKVRIFCGLTATDGFMLVAREKTPKFEWSMLKGKDVLGFRPGSTPLLFLEAALRQNGLDPTTDLKLQNNIAVPARFAAWLSGQQQYGIFLEPDASQLELDGKAHIVASIGQTVGQADYTAFMATDKYIRDNPQVLQAWTNAVYKAQRWTEAASSSEIVKLLEPYFPGVATAALTAGVDRYRKLKIWKSSPAIEPAAMEKFQDILVQGGVLDPAKRAKYPDLVVTDFAAKAH
jgi:NitT/TauT family transport system substrate-binding protein